MISFTLTSLKNAADHLYIKDTFDIFSVINVNISSYITFSMDGHTNREFFDNEESDEAQSRFCRWEKIKPLCFQIIKGKRPPVSFNILLCLSRDDASLFFNEPDLSLNRSIDNYTLKFSYINNRITGSTSTTFTEFSLDRESDRLFDECLLHWFRTLEIDVEQL